MSANPVAWLDSKQKPRITEMDRITVSRKGGFFVSWIVWAVVGIIVLSILSFFVKAARGALVIGIILAALSALLKWLGVL